MAGLLRQRFRALLCHIVNNKGLRRHGNGRFREVRSQRLQLRCVGNPVKIGCNIAYKFVLPKRALVDTSNAEKFMHDLVPMVLQKNRFQI